MRPTVRFARLAVLAAWMALITYWSSQGNLPIDQPVFANALHGSQHRVAHLVAFGLVGLLARWTFDGWPRATLLAIALTSAFGAVDEWHQTFTPGRRPAIDDWLFDTFAAAFAIYVFGRLRSTRLQPYVRRLSAVAVCAAFAVGVAFAARPGLPRSLAAGGFHGMVHSAVQLARDTRDATRAVAHQVRSG